MSEEVAGFTVAILTISDAGAKGERDDTSGDTITRIMSFEGFKVMSRDIVPDEKEQISGKIKEWCDSGDVDLVLTTGGTGLSPRDVTPEATRMVIEYEVPGISEAMRVRTLDKTPMSMLSRAVAGLRSGCLVVNLPGSPAGACQTLEVVIPVIPHAIEIIKGRRIHPTQQ
jgi:molybdenum cofactor synthesis domain-containing protein